MPAVSMYNAARMEGDHPAGTGLSRGKYQEPATARVKTQPIFGMDVAKSLARGWTDV